MQDRAERIQKSIQQIEINRANEHLQLAEEQALKIKKESEALQAQEQKISDDKLKAEEKSKRVSEEKLKKEVKVERIKRKELKRSSRSSTSINNGLLLGLFIFYLI